MQARLLDVTNKIAVLEESHATAVQRENDLAAQVDDCQRKLSRAEKLVSGLGGEKERWSNTITSVTKSIENVIGDMALCAGAISYSGAHTHVGECMSVCLQVWEHGCLGPCACNRVCAIEGEAL